MKDDFILFFYYLYHSVVADVNSFMFLYYLLMIVLSFIDVKFHPLV